MRKRNAKPLLLSLLAPCMQAATALYCSMQKVSLERDVSNFFIFPERGAKVKTTISTTRSCGRLLPASKKVFSPEDACVSLRPLVTVNGEAME